MSSDNGGSMTVKEAAQRLNLSERTVWKYIQNRSLKTSRKFSGGKKPMVMVFENGISELLRTRNIEPSMRGSMNNPEQEHNTSGNVQDVSEAPCLIPLHHYEEQRLQWLQERDNLMQGMMMYRYKFEELERQTRLLPAPLEVIPSKLTELEEKAVALAQAQVILQQAQETQKQYEKAMAQLKRQLQEEEAAKEEFRAQYEKATLPLWKKALIALKILQA